MADATKLLKLIAGRSKQRTQMQQPQFYLLR